MNDILFELLKLIVMIAVLLVMRYAIPWLRSRIGVEKMAEIAVGYEVRDSVAPVADRCREDGRDRKMGGKGSPDGTTGLLGKVWRRTKGNRNEVFTGNTDCEKYFDLRGAVKYPDRSCCKTNEDRRGQGHRAKHV